MSIEKNEVTIQEALGTYLSYTPTYAETEQLRTDLRTMNHTLIRDAILECQKSKKVPAGAPRGEKRRAMHAVYIRKVKELASLYPFLFSVENALRSFAAEVYTSKFNSAFWWREFLPANPDNKAHTKKNRADFVTEVSDGAPKKRVSGQLVNITFVDEVLYSINKAMSPTQLKSLYDGAVSCEIFYQNLTFRALCGIIHSDFTLCPVGELKKKEFQDHASKLRVARNEIFHGNPIKDRKVVYTASERILDNVSIHLGDLDEALRMTSYARFKSSVPRAARHCIPPV